MTDNLPATEAPPISIDEIESALRLITKVVGDAKALPDGEAKARTISALYRAFKTVTDDLRNAREYALIDAAVVRSEEDFAMTDPGRPKLMYFDGDEVALHSGAHHLGFAMSILGIRLNSPFTWINSNGKEEHLQMFTSDNEVVQIMRRARRRIVLGLRLERRWETRYDRQHPNPKFNKYRDR